VPTTDDTVQPVRCTCGQLTYPGICPVHNARSTISYNGATIVLSESPLPVVRCAHCQETLEVQRVHSISGGISYQAQPHRCPSVTTRVINADALTDDELLDAVKARGLVAG
jgi:hypothetical protein